MAAVAGPTEAQPYVDALGWAPVPDIVSSRLLVINAATNAIVGGVMLGDTQGPRNEHMAISPDGRRIFVVNSLERTVSVVAAQSATVLDTSQRR